MKKLYNYLDKIGASYDRVQCGSYYFQNVPELKIDAAFVYFDFYNKDTVIRWHTLEKIIEKYAARYGYAVYNRGGCLGSAWFFVARADDRETLENYMHYQNLSVSECEKAMHEHYTGVKCYENLNETLGNIMFEYGENYKNFCAAVAAAAC